MSSTVLALSLEPWDDVWRRNQHLAARLVASGRATRITYVVPPGSTFRISATRRQVLPGITVVTPPLLLPRRAGGFRALATWVRQEVKRADVVWVNDPIGGAALVDAGRRITYDVTDDWRSMSQTPQERRRIVAAEDVLSRHAGTVVCSSVLRDRWNERYGIEARLIPNGADVRALREAAPRQLVGDGPHAVYVGTLHPSRIDLDLVVHFPTIWPGTLHLVGPAELPGDVMASLMAHGVDLPGAVHRDDVLGWMRAADVLICPHVVDDFTLSLDAIKAHEYLSTDRPVVATPSSGFQHLSVPGLSVVSAGMFVEAAVRAVGSGSIRRDAAVDWDARADAFADALGLPS